MIPYPLIGKDIPSLYVSSSPEMIKDFKKFGEFVTFDLTYNMIKQFKEEGDKKKKWGLGLFLGKNNHNNPIPFGICLMNSEKKEDFVQVFRSFFDIMGRKPQSIITDQQLAIIAAL